MSPECPWGRTQYSIVLYDSYRTTTVGCSSLAVKVNCICSPEDNGSGEKFVDITGLLPDKSPEDNGCDSDYLELHGNFRADVTVRTQQAEALMRGSENNGQWTPRITSAIYHSSCQQEARAESSSSCLLVYISWYSLFSSLFFPLSPPSSSLSLARHAATHTEYKY